MLLYTSKRKIREVRKEINKIEDKNIIINPGMCLEDLVLDNKSAEFFSHLIVMTTHVAAHKHLNMAIVLDYGLKKISKFQERRLRSILEQIVYSLNFQRVILAIYIRDKDNITSESMRDTQNLVLLYKNTKLRELEKMCDKKGSTDDE